MKCPVVDYFFIIDLPFHSKMYITTYWWNAGKCGPLIGPCAIWALRFLSYGRYMCYWLSHQLIDKGCISLKILSNEYIFEDLHVFLFHTGDLDNDHASDYESTEVFNDTLESLQREVTNSIGGYWCYCCSGQYWMCEDVLNSCPNSK